MYPDTEDAIRQAYEEGYREGRLTCVQHLEALAINIRDNGPKNAEGLLTAIAGAHVGALLDAAISLRLATCKK